MRQGWLKEKLSLSNTKSFFHSDIDLDKKGCPFENRCSKSIQDKCNKEVTPEKVIKENHLLYCHQEVNKLFYE